ncbi:MAG: carboxylating nicotinate-nucleotide diphosphorylase [Sphingobacteriales bacterium]|nr:MAG: carboxylating nicotinate-nucleotide diphosphorylase [Sphingobacteriales bacterium]
MDKQYIKNFIQQALAEDVGNGDHTSLATIAPHTQGQAQLIIKDEGIIAGVFMAEAIFNEVDISLNLEFFIKDGQAVKYGDIALKVSGSVHSILMAERLVLNTMQRMSGIATTTHKIVTSLKNTHTKVLDTRKTTPNLRFLEKKAVQIGGGVNHRNGLYDMILIKDNHVDYAGSIAKALQAAKLYVQSHTPLPIVIEVRNLNELHQVIGIGGINRILLDNFTFPLLKEAVKLIDGKFDCEASGNITPENAIDYAQCGVNYISMGALTHSVKSFDMSLKAIK